LNNSKIINAARNTKKEMKTTPLNFVSLTPYNKSESKNKAGASQKFEKYIIPAKARTTETHKGIKSIENKSIAPAKIRSIIITSYLTLKLVFLQVRYRKLSKDL
jgi:hypothetical protein